jgi:hypothetical protein
MTDRPTPPPSLGVALTAWAKTEPAGSGDSAALARILDHADAVATGAQEPAASRRGWNPAWLVGGALAASVAVALLLAGTPGGRPGIPAGDTGGQVMLAEADSGSSAAFALLYTPTPEEEYQL